MFYLGAMTWVIQGFSWLFFKVRIHRHEPRQLSR